MYEVTIELLKMSGWLVGAIFVAVGVAMYGDIEVF